MTCQMLICEDCINFYVHMHLGNTLCKAAIDNPECKSYTDDVLSGAEKECEHKKSVTECMWTTRLTVTPRRIAWDVAHPYIR